MNNIVYSEPIVVAEIGCNHKGDFETAKLLITLAKECNASYAKFQKRTPKELLTKDQYDSPHPHPHNSYGKSYGLHREFLEFTVEQHREFKKYSESIGIGYATSVWDVSSAKEIIGLKPDYIKVPSACNTHFDLLETLRDDYDGDIHISFGMTTEYEKEQIIKFYEEKNHARDRIVAYACTSGYPISFTDVCLLEIKKLRDKYKTRVKGIGFSGHHLGIAIDNVAFALGSNWIERHFTKDRTWKGTDHAASLEPTGLRKLVRDLNATYLALNYKNKDILDIEIIQRKKLKYKKGKI